MIASKSLKIGGVGPGGPDGFVQRSQQPYSQ